MPDGELLAPREVGEICVRGPGVMLGYSRRPEQTAHALRDGWLHIGDGGGMDEAGYVYLADRLKQMIITCGESVYSAEVEAVLMHQPGRIGAHVAHRHDFEEPAARVACPAGWLNPVFSFSVVWFFTWSCYEPHAKPRPCCQRGVIPSPSLVRAIRTP